MANLKEAAAQAFKDNPGAEVLHLTEDGTAFFNKSDANMHHQKSGFKSEVETFYSEQPSNGGQQKERKLTKKEASAYLESIKKASSVEELENILIPAGESNQDLQEAFDKRKSELSA